VRQNLPNTKRNSQMLARGPRPAPTSDERAERRRVQEEDARIAWEEHRLKERAIEENTARLRALRLAREQQAKAPPSKGARSR